MERLEGSEEGSTGHVGTAWGRGGIFLGGVHSAGLEPTTLGFEDRCSIQLSYECEEVK